MSAVWYVCGPQTDKYRLRLAQLAAQGNIYQIWQGWFMSSLPPAGKGSHGMI